MESAIEAIVGLLIAVIISTATFSSGIRQIGTDLSQRLLLWLDSPGGALGPATATRASRPSSATWVFLDLGGAFCRPDGRKARCPPDTRRTDRSALSQILVKVRQAHPRLVVLDVETDAGPDTTAGDQKLLAELSRPGPPVLLAWLPNGYPRDSGRTALTPRDQALLFAPDNQNAPAYGRYFPAMKRMNGPAARQLEPDYDVVSRDGARRTPAIAYAAAMVIRSPSQRPWDMLDRFPADPNSRACPPQPRVDCWAFRHTERVFSFPVVRADGPRRLSLADRTPAFLPLAPDVGDELPPQLNDAVVVIGDSRPDAGDTTWSAIGNITGAELILNDIRQYLEAPPVPEASIGSRLLAEWPFLMAGAIAIFLAQASVDLRWPSPGAKSAASQVGSASMALALRTVGKLALTMVASATLFAVLLKVIPPRPGEPPDLFTPFLAILLERTFELMHHSSLFLQASLHSLFFGRGRANGAGKEG